MQAMPRPPTVAHGAGSVDCQSLAGVSAVKDQTLALLRVNTVCSHRNTILKFYFYRKIIRNFTIFKPVSSWECVCVWPRKLTVVAHLRGLRVMTQKLLN